MAVGAAALAELRQARRRRRLASFDAGEAVYRAYITFVLSGIAIWLLSGVVGDTRVRSDDAVLRWGAQAVGGVVATGWALAARAGGRGGPLALEAADVRHVLLSPVDRGAALRVPALRQLRSATAVAAGAGVVGGLLAWRRLPGSPALWLACGGAVAALGVAGGLGLAMVVSGRRVGRVGASLLALALLAWAGLDALGRVTTSPMSLLGRIALWPLRSSPIGLIGAAVAVVLAVVGPMSVAGTSIEAAERRAALVGQLRFAAALRDVRTVVVLRRQLSQEQPRTRPYVALRLLDRPAPVLRVAVRRGARSLARYPLARLVRMAVLGAAAGAAGVGAWAGTTPLLAAVGACLFVAGLDAVEPLAQELDRPDRTDGLPVDAGVLDLGLLVPSALLMLPVAALGVAAAVAVAAVTGGGTLTALEIGGVVAVPAALAGAAGAALSVVQGAPAPGGSGLDAFLPPEGAGLTSILRLVMPPGVAVLAAVPLLGAHHPPAPATAVSVAAGLLPLPLLGATLVAGYVRYRQSVRAFFTTALQDAGAKPATTPK